MDPFLELDLKIFALINQDWASPGFDDFFPKITDLHKSPVFWGVVGLLLFIWIMKKHMFAVKWILYICLCVGLSDQICYRILKPAVHRARPEQSGISLIIRGEHHDGNSFPSNHAANNFAAATALSFAFPIGTPVFFGIASLVGYSRVYVGAHYPSDVFAGAVIGIFIAFLLRIFMARLLEKPPDKIPDESPRKLRPGANRWA